METKFEKIKELINNALSEGRHSLLAPEAMVMLSIMGISMPSFCLANSIEEAQEIAEALGYPVALKIVSPDIIHKSDVGGVKLNLLNKDQVSENFKEIQKNVREKAPKARIFGIMVQKMVPSATEVVIGALRDKQFGPVIMFGLGGIFIEIIKDVSFRIAPLNKDDALEMIKEIKGYPLLLGYRGSPKLDINAVADTIVKISELMMKVDEIDQLDLNPILVYTSGLMVVDARVILSHNAGELHGRES
ncbi:MAG: acetate--CoA ligase family protein [Nitrososphaerales archaeon]